VGPNQLIVIVGEASGKGAKIEGRFAFLMAKKGNKKTCMAGKRDIHNLHPVGRHWCPPARFRRSSGDLTVAEKPVLLRDLCLNGRLTFVL
jgi:hypothetical protein